MKGTGSLVVRVKRVGWNAKFVSCLVDVGGVVGQCEEISENMLANVSVCGRRGPPTAVRGKLAVVIGWCEECWPANLPMCQCARVKEGCCWR